MHRGLRYRVVSVLGTAVLTVSAVAVTNLPAVHGTFARVPYFGRPAPEVLPGDAISVAITTTLVVVLASMWPLFKPQPRRILDTIFLTQKRMLLAMVGLAALGYFNYSYRLPRTTLMLSTAALFVALPLFMVAIRRRPSSVSRAVIVGDDPDTMRALLDAAETPVIGYVSPPSAYAPEGLEPDASVASATDGGHLADDPLDELPCLGGLARLEDVLVDHDVDTALLSFATTTREEFFSTLEICHERGVNAFVHHDYAEHVLTDDFTGTELLAVDLEPWDPQDYVIKRGFDVAFAAAALLVALPLVTAISLAIKLDDGGSVLYSQERTAAFGETFTIYKFRSMTPGEETVTPDGSETTRVTRVGRVLRKTHLDEIPQLWAILTGKMSVVGPRAAWTDEERYLEADAAAWRKRWFVKPGLTGLAQIHDATSAEPEEKLRYDLQYIRQQSFWFDLQIVVRQLWKVGADVVAYVFPAASRATDASATGTSGSTHRGMGTESGRTEESVSGDPDESARTSAISGGRGRQSADGEDPDRT